MTRKLKTKRVDRTHASTYLSKARGFRADAEAMAALDGEFSGNGLAVLCVSAGTSSWGEPALARRRDTHKPYVTGTAARVSR